MAIWPNGGAVTTQLGINLHAKMETGAQLVLTRAVAGSGFVTPSTLASQTEVKDPKQTLSMGTPVYLGDGRAEITVQLNNAQLKTGYTNWQIGIYASDPNLGEILYMLAQATEPDPIPSMSQQASVIIDHKYTIIYGTASEVTVTIDPTGLVTEGEFTSHLANAAPGILHTTEEQQAAWSGKADTATYPVALTTAAWTAATAPYAWQQVVAITGMLETDNPIADLVLQGTTAALVEAEQEAFAAVTRITTVDGGITAYCLSEKPTTAIALQLKAVR